MPNKNIEPIEGEVIEGSPVQSQKDASANGVFIGTLNIMVEPGRTLITEPLSGIYKSRYHGKFKRPKHVFAFDLLLVGIGAALATIAIYFGLIFKPFEPVQIQLTLAPKNPTSGSELVINLKVSNASDVPIKNVIAILKIPNNLSIIRSSLPYDRNNQHISFGLIENGTDATVRLVGKLSGQVGKNIRVSTIVTFIDSKTEQTTTKTASASSKIMNSSIGAEFNLPEQIIVGQILNGSIHYFNRSNETVKNISIAPMWPDGFTLIASQPVIKNGQWKIGNITPGSENTISFSGVFNSMYEEADFSLSMNDSRILKTISVINSRINLSVSGTGKARLGETINLIANYKNDSDSTLSNATIKTILDEGLELVSIENLNSDEIKPGASGKINIKIRVADVLSNDIKNDEDINLNSRVTLNGKFNDADKITITSLAFGIKISSQLGLKTMARYWSESGDQLGRGPIPPLTGSTTRYWVFWSIKNTTNPINNVRVSGQLPINVGYTGKASVPFGDPPIFDPSTRTLTWNVGNVPSWPGIKQPAISAAFELSLIPTLDQVGTYPVLITDQKISGKDGVTDLILNNSALNLNSKLTEDPKAANLGPVK